jgi:ribosome-associated toxin RatA of RatAB toxin-antitoxin module
MHSELEQVVKASPEKVFQAYGDYETWPRWSDLFSRVTVVKREGNTVHLATEAKILGRTFKGTETHEETPPHGTRNEAQGPSYVARTLWKFEPVPEGTKITWILDAELKGALAKLLGPFASRRLEPMGRKFLKDLAKYVEATGR